MGSIEEIKKNTLIKAGWTEGDSLPAKLTRPASYLQNDDGSAKVGNPDVIRQRNCSLSLREIFDDPSWPLGTNHPAYIGRTWINIFDRMGTRGEEHMQALLDSGMDMEKMVANLNRENYDKIALYSSDGCFTVETGHHRMTHLKVVYDTIMEKAGISRAEREKIKDLKLNVVVRELKYSIYPMMGDKYFTPPSFLPEMVEAEKNKAAAERKAAVSETVNTIAAELSDMPFGVGLAHKLSSMLGDDLKLAPKNIAAYFEGICKEMQTLTPAQEKVVSSFNDANAKVCEANSALSNIEKQERTLGWAIQGFKTSLEQQTKVLSNMPNPKPPGNLITRQLDSKEKQAQRTAYKKQQDICTNLNKNMLHEGETLRVLRENKTQWMSYKDYWQKVLGGISDGYRAVCDDNNQARQTAARIMNVVGKAVGELANRLNVEDPYKGVSVVMLNPTRCW